MRLTIAGSIVFAMLEAGATPASEVCAPGAHLAAVQRLATAQRFVAAQRYSEAKNVYEDILRGACEADLTGRVWNDLGASLYHLGRYAEAGKAFQNAVRHLQALGQRRPEEYLAALNNLGAYYRVVADYDKAAAIHRRSLAIRRGIHGSRTPKQLTPLTNLAEVYRNQGRLAEAESLLNEALEISGAAPLELASVLHAKGAVLRDRGELDAAERVYRRVLSIQIPLLGTANPLIAATLNNLGETLLASERYAEARPVLEQARAIWREARGDDHPDIYVVDTNLASVQRATGDYAGAERAYLRSIEGLETSVGAEHPKLAMSLMNLAHFYHSRGKLRASESVYRRALGIANKSLGEQHYRTALLHAGLGSVLASQRRTLEAERHLEFALSVLDRTMRSDDPRLVNTLRTYADIMSWDAQPEETALVAEQR